MKCPSCDVEMEDLVKTFGITEGYWMELGGYNWSKDPNLHSRHYIDYECPQCGMFLAFRTKK